ncbi:MAG TPA: IS5 family transposase [Gemmatimonadaceae bacterium]|nr:IS5 family transposase [Gemmatimonadaceae bacterium]
MRGDDQPQTALFSYVSIEDRIPADHPLRTIQTLVNPILAALSPRFQMMYSTMGRPSIPPERLLRALLLQILFTIRSERQLMEQLNYNLLFRWFVGLNPDDAVWVPTVFTKNRDRLLEGNIADAFLQEVLKAAETRGLLSHEHFTVDGTLLEAWASQKSFRLKDDPTPPPSDGDHKNPTVNFRGEKRSNTTHESVTDPDARLARMSSGTTSTLSHLGSVLMDNRHGLIVATDVRPPGYEAERDAAVEMLTTLAPRTRRRTVGADKGYDTAGFVEGARECNTTPHVAQNVHANRRESAIDERTTRHDGYAVSQVKRKLVEEGFGWSKTIGGLRKLHHRGREKVGWIFTFTNAAYDLVRIRTLIRAGVCT